MYKIVPKVEVFCQLKLTKSWNRGSMMPNSKFLTLIMPYDSFSKDNNHLKIIPTKKPPLSNW